MYSELTQQLSRMELESLTDSLEVAVAAHLNWFSNVNKALVCSDKEAQLLYAEGDSYKRSQFGRWYHNVTNTMLIENPVFLVIGALHKDMHVKVYELIKKQAKAQQITSECYQEFVDIQSNFFEVLVLLGKESAESLGNIDFLTGLPNRRAFQQILSMENNRIARSNITSSIAIADIDYFKKVNDTYGHDAGDKILTQVAEIFRSYIREYDTVSRFGGEEFVFCLPEINTFGANYIMERVRLQIEKKTFDIDADEAIHITCSFGVSNFNRNFTSTEALSYADASLYKAKESGRNRVVHHELAEHLNKKHSLSAVT